MALYWRPTRHLVPVGHLRLSFRGFEPGFSRHEAILRSGVAGSSLQNVLEIEGLRLSEAKIFRCAGSLRRCAPALARRLRRRAYPDLYVDPCHPGSPARTPSRALPRAHSFEGIQRNSRREQLARPSGGVETTLWNMHPSYVEAIAPSTGIRRRGKRAERAAVSPNKAAPSVLRNCSPRPVGRATECSHELSAEGRR